MGSSAWQIVSGSRGATCHVQNDSNMSSNGTHERHVVTCDWVKIHGRWISGEGAHLTHIFSQPVWEGKREKDLERKRKEEDYRERVYLLSRFLGDRSIKFQRDKRQS